MLIGYDRPDKRLGSAPARKVLLAYGVKEGDIHTEKPPERGDHFPIRTWIIGTKVRPKHKDQIIIARADRLATSAKGWMEAVKAAHKRKAVVIDASTGERSDRECDLLEMFHRTSKMYAGRWLPTERARELGIAGAEASPVTKAAEGRMPWRQAVAIMNRHELTVDEAIAVINSDRRYKAEWSRNTIYRVNRDPETKLKIRARMPGWAQAVGEVLPLTHFLRVVRGILLKGNGLAECRPDLWPIALFLVVMLAIGIKRYRQTLD